MRVGRRRRKVNRTGMRLTQVSIREGGTGGGPGWGVGYPWRNAAEVQRKGCRGWRCRGTGLDSGKAKGSEVVACTAWWGACCTREGFGTGK